MKELSLNILDIAQNSVSAKASEIEITVEIDHKKNEFRLTIIDNGKGMTEEFLKTVTDPFTTTRTTRKVGMGISLLKLAAEQAGGGIRYPIKNRLWNNGDCCVPKRPYRSGSPWGDWPDDIGFGLLE